MNSGTKAIFLILGLSFLFTPNFLTGALASEAPGDIRYQREGATEEDMGPFPPSIFPHWIHRIRFRCDACHDSLFEMKLGGTPVTMDLIAQGEVCGKCHNGDLAFSVKLGECHRCHVASEE